MTVEVLLRAEPVFVSYLTPISILSSLRIYHLLKGSSSHNQNFSHPLEKRTRLVGSVLSAMNNSLASHLELPPFRDGLDVLST